jgi:hypothetical protein
MQGWIKLHRQLLEWEWYDDINTSRLFIHLLLRANHKDNNWKGKLIKRGQLISSLDKLSTETGLSKSQIRTSIKKLISTHEIAHEGKAQHTVFTIKSYDSYQGDDTLDSTRVTHKSHTDDTQIAPNNNDKKEKNEDLMVSDKPKPTWDFELCKTIWNEEKSISECPATGCNLVPAKLKSGLGKVHKAYQAFCKSSGKIELDRHEWFRAYAKGHLKRCESFVGKSDGYSWKPSIANLAEMKTFEALINQ